MNTDELARLLSRLTALKQNLPKSSYTPEKYADELNSILSGLEKISGGNLEEFKILQTEINPRVTSFSYIGEETTYSNDKYADRDFVAMKIDGVLGYFTLKLQPEEIQNKIGFRVDQE